MEKFLGVMNILVTVMFGLLILVLFAYAVLSFMKLVILRNAKKEREEELKDVHNKSKMKVIVSSIPAECGDCLFSELYSDGRYVCILDNHNWCENICSKTSSCPCLETFADAYFDERFMKEE